MSYRASTILFVFVFAGAIIGCRPSSPAPAFPEDRVAWITARQTAEGRPPDADQWQKLVSAAEAWRKHERLWYEQYGETRYLDLQGFVRSSEFPDAAEPTSRAIEVINACEAEGALLALREWRVAGGPRAPWVGSDMDRESTKLNHAGMMALAAARVRAHQGDIDAAIELLWDARECANAGRADRTFWSHGTFALICMMDQEIRRLVLEYSLSEIQMQNLLRLVTSPIVAIEEVYEGGHRMDESPDGMLCHKLSPKLFATSSEHRRAIIESRILRATFWEEKPTYLNGMREQKYNTPALGSVGEYTASEVVESVRYWMTETWRHELIVLVEQRATACMLAIELYRVKHSRLPNELQEAVRLAGLPDEICQDVSAGQPFVYRIDDAQPRGYALYAVGADGIDNGGRSGDGHSSNAIWEPDTQTDYDMLAPRQALRDPK